MSDSAWPHRRQPTRLPHPWDSPGKNTRVGCHFLLRCMKLKSESEGTQSCLTLSDPMDCSPPRLLHPWDFPGKSTGVGCHCLLRTNSWSVSNLKVKWCLKKWILWELKNRQWKIKYGAYWQMHHLFRIIKDKVVYKTDRIYFVEIYLMG